MQEFFSTYGQAAQTAIGFFWKSGWAFVLGYSISAMIQVFVPKKNLTSQMGEADFKSISISTIFGTISSSCSFAALSAARSLILKGAHWISVVAFMFASTNLVIELGILILIFLGWQFLVAEIIGGLLLIMIASVLIRLTYPQDWLESAREKVQEESQENEDSFDWKEKLQSFDAWTEVGDRFFGEWGMVWQEILIGFTIAGFIAVFVPNTFWETIFLADFAQDNPGNFLVVLENAMVAPLVAASTFIGSMGNIPLATVLNSGGVLFAGIIGFIYSDLMVPPLVRVNAKYYGWRVALYIAAMMYISIVLTAIILHYGFLLTNLTPESARAISDITTFEIDYTFFLNIGAIVLTGIMFWLRKQYQQKQTDDSSSGFSWDVQSVITLCLSVILIGGLVSLLFTSV